MLNCIAQINERFAAAAQAHAGLKRERPDCLILFHDNPGAYMAFDVDARRVSLALDIALSADFPELPAVCVVAGEDAPERLVECGIRVAVIERAAGQ